LKAPPRRHADVGAVQARRASERWCWSDRFEQARETFPILEPLQANYDAIDVLYRQVNYVGPSRDI